MAAKLAILSLTVAALMAQASVATAAARCRAQSDREIVASIPTPSASGLEINSAALAAIGYRNLEIADGVLSAPSAAPEILRRNRLTLVGARETLNLKTWDAVVARAKSLELEYLSASNVGLPGVGSLEDTLQTAANLNVMGEAAREQKITLIVRIGRDELAAVYPYDLRHNGQVQPTRAFDIIADRTDPDHVAFDIDAAGAILAYGPAGAPQGVPDLLAANRGRIRMLHMRDMLPGGAPAVLGHGAIDWPGVFAAAGGGVRYYLADQPSMTPSPTGMAQARADFDYLRCRS